MTSLICLNLSFASNVICKIRCQIFRRLMRIYHLKQVRSSDIYHTLQKAGGDLFEQCVTNTGIRNHLLVSLMIYSKWSSSAWTGLCLRRGVWTGWCFY